MGGDSGKTQTDGRHAIRSSGEADRKHIRMPGFSVSKHLITKRTSKIMIQVGDVS